MVNEGITVLSLCDGMSCGHIALDRAGIKVKKYYASEIKDIGIKVTKANYPDTVHIGDVNKVSYSDGVLRTEYGIFDVDNIDLVIFGSPCQSFSIAMRKNKRTGLQDKNKSGLFLECYRILKEVKPRWFLVENVASMKNVDRNNISEMLGVEPILIDSATVSPLMRKRYYWTNISNIRILRKNITLQMILEEGYTNREKGHCLMVSDSRPLKTSVKMFHRYYCKGFGNLIFKDEEHYKKCCDYYDKHYKGMKVKDISTNETDIFDGVRYMNQRELERCQTVPEGYTSCLTRNETADVLGDGWTVDVIATIFKGMKSND